MANDLGRNPEQVYLAVMSDDGKKLYKGNVKINNGTLNLAHAIRLLKMPTITLTNTGGRGHGRVLTGSSPQFSPIRAVMYFESSLPLAFQCCMKGSDIGQVKIYQLMSSGESLIVLSEYTLEHARIVELDIVYNAASDEFLGHGGLGFVTLTGTSFGVVQSQIGDDGSVKGKKGVLINKVKQTVDAQS